MPKRTDKKKNLKKESPEYTISIEGQDINQEPPKTKLTPHKMENMKAYVELSHVNGLDKLERKLLIEKGGVRGLKDLAGVQSKRLIKIFCSFSHPSWINKTDSYLKEKAEKVSSHAKSLLSGQVLRNDIPNLGSRNAKKLANCGYYHIYDIAAVSYDNLLATTNSIKKTNLEIYKRRANFGIGALLPAQILSILEKFGINTLTGLVHADKEHLVKQLFEYIRKLSKINILQLLATLLNYYEEILQNLGPVTETIREERLKDRLKSINYSIRQCISADRGGFYEKLFALIAILVDFWTDLAAERLRSEPQDVQSECNCMWEDSNLSEKAYLFYLVNTFYPFVDLSVELGVDINRLEDSLDEFGKAENVTQRYIQILQRDLREKKKHLFIPSTFENKGRRYLDYNTWLAFTINAYYPELSFNTRIMKNLPDLPSVFTNPTVQSGISELTYELITNAIKSWTEELSSRFNDGATLQARTQWQGRLIDIPDLSYLEAEWAKEYKTYYIDHTESKNANSWDVQSHILVYENKGAALTLNMFFQRYGSIFRHLLNFNIGVRFASQEIYNSKESTDPTVVASENARIADGFLNNAIKELGQLEEVLGRSCTPNPSGTHNAFDTIRLYEFDLDKLILKFKETGEDAWENYRSSLSRLSFSRSEHWSSCLGICNSYFLLPTGYVSSGANTNIPVPNHFYLEDTAQTTAPRGLERLAEAFSLPNVEGILNGRRGRLIFKEFGAIGPDQTIISLVPNYTGFLVQWSQTGSFEGDEYVTDFTGSWASVAQNLDTVEEINNDLRIFMTGAPSNSMTEHMEKTIPDFESLRNLLLGLIYRLPYIKQFIVPLAKAEILTVQEQYEEALRWLSIIHDVNGNDCEIILPFKLTPAEINVSRLALGQVLLSWAEKRYRENTYESLYHAEELYARVIQLFSKEGCDKLEEFRVMQELLTHSLKKGVDPKVHYELAALVRSTRISRLTNPIRRKLSEMKRLKGLELDKAITKFVVEYRKELTSEIPIGNHLENRKRLAERAIKREANWKVYPPLRSSEYSISPYGWLDSAAIVERKNVNKLIRIGTRQDVSLIKNNYPKQVGESYLPENFEKIPPGGTCFAWAYDLCIYPNPKIVAMLNEARYRLTNLHDFRNFYGYRKDDVSIYTYDELLSKARYYISLAVSLEKEYLQYYESWQREKENKLGAFANLLTSEATVDLGKLMIEEAHEQQVLADVQYEAADNAVKDAERVQSFRGLPVVAAVRFWSSSSQGTIGGASAGSQMGPVGVAVGAGLGFLNSFFNFAEETMLAENQMNRLQDQRNISSQNRNVAAAHVAVIQQQLNVYKLNLVLCQANLNLLLNKEIGEETYKELFRMARWLYKKYVDFAGCFAWLAQRELEFNRCIVFNTIRCNYYQYENQGLLAAEMLQDDIESLNYQHELTQQKYISRIKTLSLATLFPIRFQKFLDTGEFHFTTSSDYLRLEQTGRKMVYNGHYKIPDEWGLIQQRIETVELRFIGLIAPSKDLNVTLLNSGISVVIAENDKNELGISPAVLLRPPQRISLDRAQGEGTGTLYSREGGIRRPFENIGLDTNWLLTVNRGSTAIELKNLVDIEVVIKYRTQYNYRYELIQKERSADGSSYLRIPAKYRCSRTFAFWSGEFSDQFYILQNPSGPAGFRDIRIARFQTQNTMFGPNECGHEIEEITLYLRTLSEMSVTPNLYMMGGPLNSSAAPLRLGDIKTDLKNAFEDPPGSGNILKIRGFVDASNAESAASGEPPREINELFKDNKEVDRMWGIKIVPEEQPNEFRKKNVAGEYLNTRNKPIDIQTPEVLYARTTSGKRAARLKLNDARLGAWDNYIIQLKVSLLKGNSYLRFNVADLSGICVRLRPDFESGIEIGTFRGLSQTPVVGTAVWPNPINIRLRKGEWYVLECLSFLKQTNASERFVSLMIDGVIIWEGYIQLGLQSKNGGVEIQSQGVAEAKFDDLIIDRIDGKGNRIMRLFTDTFDGTQSDNWEGLDNGAITAPFFGLVPDENPALDISDIKDIYLIIDYSYAVGE